VAITSSLPFVSVIVACALTVTGPFFSDATWPAVSE
jgi:hypothetical protein